MKTLKINDIAFRKPYYLADTRRGTKHVVEVVAIEVESKENTNYYIKDDRLPELMKVTKSEAEKLVFLDIEEENHAPLQDKLIVGHTYEFRKELCDYSVMLMESFSQPNKLVTSKEPDWRDDIDGEKFIADDITDCKIKGYSVSRSWCIEV